ncbi:FAD binding domain-containing protein [Tissierella praeacuta]|uniref:FAD binding domain-containing protein n=1 Tax=Tissierella praeacuta TaxID=43131 RepID=UPI0033423E11
MITFGDYILPKDVDEAYSTLISKKSARLIGGGCFLRMGNRRIGLAIDLSQAGINYINELEEEVEIGGMTSLRDYETSEILKGNFGDIIEDSVKHIIGVQLRSIATIGATVYSKYGFSDPITALLALNADIYLYKGGRISLEEYLKEENRRKDILEKIIIKKNVEVAAFETLRNSAVDYAILSVGASRINGKYRISIGARPRVATLAYRAMEYINSVEVNEDTATKAGELASEEIHFGTNNRGTGEYRKETSKILVKRALLGVQR